jgi:hypothetical protein
MNRTPQTLRDHIEIERRRLRAGPDYDRMCLVMANLKKNQMLEEARQVMSFRKVPRPDRLCKRNRIALMSWFCEYAHWYLWMPQPEGTPRVLRNARITITDDPASDGFADMLLEDFEDGWDIGD